MQLDAEAAAGRSPRGPWTPIVQVLVLGVHARIVYRSESLSPF